MPVFTLDVTVPIPRRDYLNLAPGYIALRVPVLGLLAGDQVVGAAFCAELPGAPDSTDLAATTVHRSLVAQDTGWEGIRTSSGTPAAVNLDFLLKPDEVKKLETAHDYDVRVWVKRGTDIINRVVQWGTISVRQRLSDTVPADFVLSPPAAGDTVGAATTPGALYAQYNAAGPGQLDALYVEGYSQTLVVDATSATGYRCTLWDDAVNPGHGKHWRPSTDRPTGHVGAGAAAIPFNVGDLTAGGMVVGEGLDIPGSVGFDAFTTDNTNPPAIAGSATLKDFFYDRTKGREWGFISKLSQNTIYLLIGEDIATGYSYDPAFLDATQRYNTAASAASGLVDGQDALHSFHSAKFVDQTGYVAPLYLNTHRLWRDHINFDYIYSLASGKADLTAGGPRRLQLIPNLGGQPQTTTNQQLHVVYLVRGRSNGAQQKLLQDYAEAEWPTVYKDTRTRMFMSFGNSYDAPMTGDMFRLGRNGATALPSDVCVQPHYDFGGMNIRGYMGQVQHWTLEDMDMSKRTIYAVLAGEWENGGLLAENYKMAELMTGVSSKVKLGLHPKRTIDNSVDVGGEVADEAANYASHGAIAFLDFFHMTNNDPYHWNGGAPNKRPYLWVDGGTEPAQHPNDLGEELWLGMDRAAALRLLGESWTGLTAWIKPSVDFISLSTGTPTGSVTWTPHNQVDATTINPTVHFVSLDTGIATVDSVSGVVTRVATGNARIKAIAQDGTGAIGVLIAQCA